MSSSVPAVWFRRLVRLAALVGTSACPSACMHPRLSPLRVSSLGTSQRLTGHFVGRTTIERGVLTVHFDTARVRVHRIAPPDSATLEGISVRAVIATDSAGRWIPMGVGAAVAVAETMRGDEVRELWGLELSVPLPPAARVRDLWIVFQFRATHRATDGQAVPVLSYACSETNLMGRTRSARARATRLRADYVYACRL